MIEVVVAPAPQCERTARGLYDTLSEYGAVALATGGEYLRGRGDPELLLLGLPRLESAGEAPCVLVVTEGARIPQVAAKTAVVLLDGAPFSPFDGVGQVVSCGLGGKDTVTLSSLTGAHPMLALLRPLRTLSGEILEPLELPMRGNHNENWSGLPAAGAVLLLCGWQDRLAQSAQISH